MKLYVNVNVHLLSFLFFLFCNVYVSMCTFVYERLYNKELREKKKKSIEMFWLHFWKVVMSSIFIYGLCL